MARLLIVIVVGLALGVLWPWLGRLPGDFIVHHGNFTLYAPIATCFVVSVVLSFLFWMLQG